MGIIPESWIHKAAMSASSAIGRQEVTKRLTYGFLYRGRGYVQLTGRANYATWAELLNEDIVNNPDLVAKNPVVAARILVEGMRDGRFRQRRLSEFLNGGDPDFFNARDIINGDKKIVDKGASKNRGIRVAEIAERYLAVLADQ